MAICALVAAGIAVVPRHAPGIALIYPFGGITNHSVLFYTDRPDNAQHFNFNNAVVNGVAFWTLGLAGGEIAFNNAQGCTQLIADKINLNDVRFGRCAFKFSAVPEPSSLLGGLLLGGVLLRRRRAR